MGYAKQPTFCLVAFMVAGFLSSHLNSQDQFQFQQTGAPRLVTGKILRIDDHSNLLFRENDGRIWELGPDDYQDLQMDSGPIQKLSQAEFSKRLLSELPGGFRIHCTKNYVIAYETSADYAQWVGALYERLYSSFRNYWKTREFRTVDPAVPLAVIVFDTPESYARFVEHDLGQAPGSMVAYYNLYTNRVAMYDLTQTSRQTQGEFRRAQSIGEILSSPAASAMVSTVVHEATHQIMLNCGMQQRLADNPLWVSEGLAVYFETPDLKSKSGWRSMGKVNWPRLVSFRSYLRQRPANSLWTLIASDDRFRDPQLASQAYGEAWLLNYYLLKRQRRAFVRYLKTLSELEPQELRTADERVQMFEEHFGSLTELDSELIEFARELTQK